MDDWLLLSLASIAVITCTSLFVLSRWTPRFLSPYLQMTCLGTLVFAIGQLASMLVQEPFNYAITIAFIYTGLYAAVAGWLMTIVGLVEHQRQDIALPMRNLPLVMLGLSWLAMITNPVHGLFIELNVGARSSYGVLWYATFGAVWLLVVAAVALLVQQGLRAEYSDDRRQLMWCGIAMMTPLLFNAAYVLSDTSSPFDLTVIGFAISTSLLVYAIFGRQVYSATGVRLEDALDADSRPTFMTDRQGRLVHANAAAVDFFATDFHREVIEDWLAARLADREGQAAKAEALAQSAQTLWRLRDTDRWVSIARTPVKLGRHIGGHLWSVQEHTDRVRVDVATENNRRMESLGLMASGIAHDFNNLLVSVIGNADLAELYLDRAPQRIPESLKHIRSAGETGANLARQLLAFIGSANIELAEVDLNQVVQDFVSLLKPSTRSEVTFELQLDPSQPTAWADTAQISQILLNLIINAEEALTDGGGRIIVTTGAANLNHDELQQLSASEQASPGAYATLSVQDSGPGIEQADLDKVFDPFFTTKEFGRGLGLATTLGLVRSHRGAIALRSRADVGSRFTVYLPQQPKVAANEQLPASGASFDGLKALLVDDNPGVLQVHGDMLQSLGFSVTTADSGEAALTAYDGQDLAVLDLTMPGMSGVTLAARLREVAPTLPILLVSGYAAHEFEVGQGVEFLAKPFSNTKLMTAIQRAFDAQRVA